MGRRTETPLGTEPGPGGQLPVSLHPNASLHIHKRRGCRWLISTHLHPPPILHSVLTKEKNLLSGKKTADAYLTKKTLLHPDLQQLPTDKGKKVESIVQPGLSAYQEAKPSCLLLGFF